MKRELVIIALCVAFALNHGFAQTGLLSLSQLSQQKDYKNIQEAINNHTSVYKLSMIDISYTLFMDKLDTFPNLQSLRLMNNEISSFSYIFKYLTLLQELTIFENNITTLPSDIGYLVHLKKLYLNSNGLYSLPQQLINLTMLEELDLSFNRLRALPNNISQLTSLRKLTLTGNYFSAREVSLIRNMLPLCTVIN